MTMRRLFTIVCDICHTERDDASAYSAEVREEARAEGWRRRKGKDVCPSCLKRGES